MSEEKNKVSILCPYKRLLPDSISVTLWITVTASQTTLVLQKESFCFFCDLTACSPLFVTIALQATDFSAPGSCSLPPLPHVEFRSFSPQQLIHLLTKNSLPSWRHSFFLQQKYLLNKFQRKSKKKENRYCLSQDYLHYPVQFLLCNGEESTLLETWYKKLGVSTLVSWSRRKLLSMHDCYIMWKDSSFSESINLGPQRPDVHCDPGKVT